MTRAIEIENGNDDWSLLGWELRDRARAQSIAATMCHDRAYAAARRLISVDRETHV